MAVTRFNSHIYPYVFFFVGFFFRAYAFLQPVFLSPREAAGGTVFFSQPHVDAHINGDECSLAIRLRLFIRVSFGFILPLRQCISTRMLVGFVNEC